MKEGFDFRQAILDSWKTTNRTTIFLLENFPSEIWEVKIPGSSRRTIGMTACHIHNSRCSWIKMLVKRETIKVPSRVDAYKASRKEVITALSKSSRTMLQLIEACFDNGGRLPVTPPWLNFPNDIIHFLSYFVAHEAHHRGQLILLARQFNHRLPAEVTDGVWHWTRRLKEAM